MYLIDSLEGLDSIDGSDFPIAFVLVGVFVIVLLFIGLNRLNKQRNSEDTWGTVEFTAEVSAGEETQEDSDDCEEWSSEDEEFFRRSLGFLVQEGSVTDLDLVDEDESEVHRLTDNLTLCVILYDEYVYIVVENDGVMYLVETNIEGY